ncbi:acyl-CoA dehydrogenase [Myxococcota bacterium]|nr:acyl-CoA dehydrogenase [Myxococcota bacterium]
MDLAPNEEQQAILDAVESLLGQRAGAARAIELDRLGEADADLQAELDQSGFLDIALDDEMGFLEAVLVVEAISQAGGLVTAGASALVAPGVAGESLPGPVALMQAGDKGPVRYAAQARTLLVDAGDEAFRVEIEPGAFEVVTSNVMFPLGRAVGELPDGDSLGAGSGALLRNWWRVALAAEMVGAMQAALDVTVEFVTGRRQFGRAIGSFQAVQHRLATCAVLVEGSRWLVREAAFRGAPPEAAATAAGHAAAAAGRLFEETQQLTGAMGYTREHDLHVWSMRLQALRLELGGAGEHRRAAARARWLDGGSGA